MGSRGGLDLAGIGAVLIKTIGERAKARNEAAHHCLVELKKAGPDAELQVGSHEVVMDYQASCVLTATLMARSSPYARYAHRACAGAGRDSAAACDGQQTEI
jgi:hypothetical protein